MSEFGPLLAELRRIACALERLAPEAPARPDWRVATAWLCHDGVRCMPVERTHALPLALLQGVDAQKAALLENVTRFAAGQLANHALLWGARGTGKSSLVKAVHRELVTRHSALKLIEIAREDIGQLPSLLVMLRGAPERFILLCDDLSFDAGDAAYKSLKSVLDGGIAGPPPNVLFCATSNRRHLLPRDMLENEQGSAIHPGEAVEEKVSLSDRFGLWLGFHALDQAAYLAIVAGYLQHFGDGGGAEWRQPALTWAAGRGARSGRVAWQFYVDFAGRHGIALTP